MFYNNNNRAWTIIIISINTIIDSIETDEIFLFEVVKRVISKK